jgi:hypothetical protein
MKAQRSFPSTVVENPPKSFENDSWFIAALKSTSFRKSTGAAAATPYHHKHCLGR